MKCVQIKTATVKRIIKQIIEREYTNESLPDFNLSPSGISTVLICPGVPVGWGGPLVVGVAKGT